MEAERNSYEMPFQTDSESNLNRPLVYSSAAFLLGFAIGSGRWSWFSQAALKLGTGLGTYALSCMAHSFQDHYPQLFGKDSPLG